MSGAAVSRGSAVVGGLLLTLLLRVAGGLALLFVISVLVFALVHLTPGDVVTSILGPQNTSQAAIDAITERYHLNDPPVQQYLAWLGNVMSGDWGTSYRQQAPVGSIIAERSAVSLSLVAVAFLFAAVIAVPLGIAAASRPGTWRDQTAMSLSIIGISAPSFVVAFLLMLVFAAKLGWFPLFGYGSGGLDSLWHLVLPATALAFALGATMTKITRTVMIRELSQEYITFARARGMSEPQLRRLALGNATIPILTSAALVITSLVAGTILVETVFALPGIGRLLYDAVLYKDLPTVQAATLVIATVIIVVAIVVDLLCTILDPRMRRKAAA